MARPIQGIAPFKGKAAKWLAHYLETHKPDPKKTVEQARKDAEIAEKIRPLPRQE